jgi:outer membrane protein assembly factor BamE (lipoprotein component of BamABCDE complex)
MDLEVQGAQYFLFDRKNGLCRENYIIGFARGKNEKGGIMKKGSSKNLVTMCGFLSMMVVFLFVVSACNQSEPPAPQQQTQAPVAVAPQQQQMPAQSSGQAVSTNTQSAQAFNQIHMGMTSQEVIAILGQPGRTEPENGGTELEYYTSQGKFEVKLQNDKVVSFKLK